MIQVFFDGEEWKGYDWCESMEELFDLFCPFQDSPDLVSYQAARYYPGIPDDFRWEDNPIPIEGVDGWWTK